MLQKASSVSGQKKDSPLEMMKARKAASAFDKKAVETAIAEGHTIQEIRESFGLSPLAVSREIEHYLRKNPLVGIMDIHVDSGLRPEIEEALINTSGSIKKALAILGAAFNEEQVRIVRGFLVGGAE